MDTKDFGASRKDEEKELGRDGSLFANRFTDFGKYRHRVLSRPMRIEYVSYPTLTTSQDTGEVIQVWKRIYLPKKEHGQTIIDKLAAADKTIQIRKGTDPKKAYSIFSRRTRYLYIVISRDLSEDEIVVTHWEYPDSVARALSRLQKEESSKDKRFLKYGPYYAYDVIVEKVKDEEKLRKTNKEWMATSYTVSPDVEFLADKGLLGKIPKEAIEDRDWKGKTKLINMVFTEEELEAIEEYPHSLDSLVTVLEDDDAIMEVLTASPIYLFAKDSSDNKVFKYAEELSEHLLEKVIPVENRLSLPDDENVGEDTFDDSELTEDDEKTETKEVKKEDKVETSETTISVEEEDDDLDW